MREHDSPYPPGTYNFLEKTDIENENAREMETKEDIVRGCRSEGTT